MYNIQMSGVQFGGWLSINILGGVLMADLIIALVTCVTTVIATVIAVLSYLNSRK